MPVEMGDLSHAYQEACHQVRSRIERFARGYWAQMPNYRDEAIKDMVAAITPRVLAGQEAVAELTDAYLVACADLMGLAAPTGEVMASEIAAGLRGVDPYLVYERPGKEVYRRLSEGKDIDAAAKAGGLRLLNLIGTDIQLARTRQGHRSMSSWGGDQFYRRTLTGRENCALCTIASTQHYRVDHVMPIHPGCDCGFEPLPPGVGIEQVIEPKRLEAAHKAVADAGLKVDRGGRLPDYSKIILETRHGEVGPILLMSPRKNRASNYVSFLWKERKKPWKPNEIRKKAKSALSMIDNANLLPYGIELPKLAAMPRTNFAGGRVRARFLQKKNRIEIDHHLEHLDLSIIHEYCHAIDWHLGGCKKFASETPGSLPNKIYLALCHTYTGENLKDGYPSMGRKVFARGCAQYVAMLNRNDKMLAQIESIHKTNGMQWSKKEMRHVAYLFEQLALQLKHDGFAR